MMRRATTKVMLLLSALLATGATVAQGPAVGAAAPAFALPSVVRGAAVDGLATGVVHVLEFWGEQAASGLDRAAVWAKLRKQHGKKLRIAAVVGPSEDYDLDAVAAFYAENGAGIETSIGFDADGSLHERWVAASGQEPPVTFLVDAEGRLAWVGGAGLLPLALPQVVAGNYDAAKLAQQTEDANERIMKLALTTALKPSGAIAVLDELVAKYPVLEDLAVALAWGSLLESDEPELATPLQPRVLKALLAAGDAWSLNGLAWSIVDPTLDAPAEQRNLDVAMRAAVRAVELSGSQDPQILDTLARVWFWKKDYKQAAELQQRAVALCGEDDAELRDELDATRKQYEALRDGK